MRHKCRFESPPPPFSWAHTTNPIIKHLTNVSTHAHERSPRAATRRQAQQASWEAQEIQGPVVERFRSPIRIPVEKTAWLIKNRWRNSDAAALSSICKQESQTSTDRLSSLIIPRLPLVILWTRLSKAATQSSWWATSTASISHTTTNTQKNLTFMTNKCDFIKKPLRGLQKCQFPSKKQLYFRYFTFCVT